MLNDAALRLLAHRAGGGIRRLLPGGRGPLLVAHPAAIEDLLSSHADDFVKSVDDAMRGVAGRARLYDAFRTVTGSTLGGSGGDAWRRRRAPTATALGRHAATPDAIATAARETLTAARASAGPVVDLYGLGRRVAARVFLDALLGPLDPDERARALDALLTLDALVNRPWAPRPAVRRAHEDARALLSPARIAAAPTGTLGAGLRDEAGAEDADWVPAELLAFYLVGGEPVAAGMAQSLALLARSADGGAALREAVRGASPAAFVESDALAAVVLETLRLYPPVWAIGRTASRACDFRGHAVRPGDLAVAFVWGAHRHPDYFAEPDRFRPERFLGPAGGRARAALRGFGAGPRRCPGRSVALRNASVVLGTALSMLEVGAMCPSPRPILRITLRPQSPLEAPVRWLDGT